MVDLIQKELGKAIGLENGTGASEAVQEGIASNLLFG